MCGICGVVYRDPNRVTSYEVVRQMSDTIFHRGPDAEGIYIGQQAGLGSRRLSIIDLSSGDQPIYNEDNSLVIIFNGEIYNYPSLRAQLIDEGHIFYTHSDTETILHGYEKWGCDIVNHLNGMFTFALWDTRHRQMFIARDRTGIKPLYYTQTPDGLIFGSEIKALLAHPGVERQISRDALDAYLSFEYVPTPLSIFENIYKLPPGHYLLWRDGNLAIEPYWDMLLEQSEEPVAERHEQRLLDQLHSVLRQSVEMEMIADVPIGVLLSGGVDSSMVAAVMAEISPGNVQSFSIGMEDPSFDESGFARIVATHLGTHHHELIVRPQDLIELVPQLANFMDEPLADSSMIPTTLLSRFTRQYVKVALGGDGGDELFGGYSTLQAHRLMNIYQQWMPAPLRHRLIPALVHQLPTSFNNISTDFKAKRFVKGTDLPLTRRHQEWLGSFSEDEKAKIVRPELRRTQQETYELVEDKLAHCRSQDMLNRVLYLDMKMYLEGDILPKVDRASMSASLEVRVPLLNTVMLEFAARLPHQYKLHGLETKYLLRRAAESKLPKKIWRRGKKGFNIPVAKWIAGPILDLTLDMLHPDRLRRESFFEPDAVQDLLRDHLAQRRDARKLLWTLLTFELWYERWGS